MQQQVSKTDFENSDKLSENQDKAHFMPHIKLVKSQSNRQKLAEKNWNSGNITQFELAKLVYVSGFLTNANLTATTKLVLMALIQHYNANNADMFPSQKFLAKQLGISEKSVERSIANLKSEDYIYYVTKRVNRYRFTAHFFETIKGNLYFKKNLQQINKVDEIDENENMQDFTTQTILEPENLNKKSFDFQDKMSDDVRQNVGCDIRQNVGQTNKKEKKINKEFFSQKEELGNLFREFDVKNAADAAYTNYSLQGFSKNDEYGQQNKCNCNATWAKFPDLNGRWDELQMQRQKGQKGMKAQKDELTQEEKISKKQDDSGNNHLKEISQCASGAWFSPLDFEKDDAKIWIQKLPIALKNSHFATVLREKFAFSDDDIYSHEQKEKLQKLCE